MDWGKYIVVERMGLEMGIMFDPLIDHSTVAAGIGQTPVAAGFFQVYRNVEAPSNNICVSAFGKSQTLNIASRGDADAQVLNKIIGAVRD